MKAQCEKAHGGNTSYDLFLGRSFYTLSRASFVNFKGRVAPIWGRGVPNGFIFGAFWEPGGIPGRVGRPIGTRDGWGKSAVLHFRRFWSPNGAPKGVKMEPKSI